MPSVQRKLSNTFHAFFKSKKAEGIVLLLVTALSLLLANSLPGADYVDVWHAKVAGLSVEHWINDGLMAIFFLMIIFFWSPDPCKKPQLMQMILPNSA